LEKAKITRRQFIKARKDVTKVLEFVHTTFGNMTLPIQMCVVITRLAPMLPGWHNWKGPQVFDQFNDRSRSLPFIRNDVVAVASCQKRWDLRHIVALSTCEHTIQGIPQGIHDQMDFGTEPALTASERLGRLPPVAWGAPAAQACARMRGLSSTSHSKSGSVLKC